MAIKFEKVKPGMVLLDIHRQRMGNTTLSAWGLWHVRIIEVNEQQREAFVSWNDNRPEWWPARKIERLYAKETKAYREQQERRSRGALL